MTAFEVVPIRGVRYVGLVSAARTQPCVKVLLGMYQGAGMACCDGGAACHHVSVRCNGTHHCSREILFWDWVEYMTQEVLGVKRVSPFLQRCVRKHKTCTCTARGCNGIPAWLPGVVDSHGGNRVRASVTSGRLQETALADLHSSHMKPCPVLVIFYIDCSSRMGTRMVEAVLFRMAQPC